MINSGKVKVNCKDSDGAKAVLIAASNGHLQVLKTLIINGCNFLVVDHHGNNILHRVCLWNDVDLVRYVLSLGHIDINGRGLQHRTPVMNAVQQGNVHVVALLVDNGCDLSIADAFCNTALHIACAGDNGRMVEYLLAVGRMDINIGGEDGMTPVMIAAQHGSWEIFDILVEEGGSLLLTDNYGNTVLHLAYEAGSYEIVEYFLAKHKQYAHFRNVCGYTPAHTASVYGHQELAEFLLEQ